VSKLVVAPVAKRLRVALCGLALLAGTWGGLVSVEGLADESSPGAAAGAPPVEVETITLPSFRSIAKRARPGVVHIRSAPRPADLEEFRKRLEQRQKMTDEEWETFLRTHPMDHSSASGIVLDAQGHILTNDHVVRNRGTLTVRLDDGREFAGEVVGGDRETDLAVIRIDADDLRPLPFGDSDLAEVGDWVVAVGAPFGFTQTLTHGIISAKSRSNVLSRRDISYQNFLQTDAAINPGNSGGPLLNLRGEVIGVNTAIAASEDGTNSGVSFTIPSNMAGRIAEMLKSEGVVSRGWLGVNLAPIDAETARLFGLPKSAGALIDVVYEDAPAYKAGLQCEDVVIGINGADVHDTDDARRMIADVLPGDRARLQIYRDGAPQEVTVSVGRRPRNPNAQPLGTPVQGRKLAPLGLVMRALRPNEKLVVEQSGGPEAGRTRLTHLSASRGVLVVSSADAPAAWRGDFQPGELVVAVDGTDVARVDELRAALERAAGARRATLQVVDHQGNERQVIVKLQ
jgi:serine protease Do